MAQRQEDLRTLESSTLYRRYLDALRRHGDPRDEAPSPGHVIRRCNHCGMKAMFRLDLEGTWHECLHCGHLA
jgi:hypothetical protein